MLRRFLANPSAIRRRPRGPSRPRPPSRWPRLLGWSDVSETDPRLLALLDEPVARALAAAAGDTPCHLVGGVLRDRLLDFIGRDFDAVVGDDGQAIAERLAGRLPARLVHLGGDAFAAYRLVGEGFVLDLWDRRGQSLEQDLARRDFTVNAFALDLASRRVVDPFGGVADLERRRLRATTPGVLDDDPLRVLRLVRLGSQMPGFSADPQTQGLARTAAGGLAGVAAERIREELGKILGARDFAVAFARLVDLRIYPGLLRQRPGEAGDASGAVRLLDRLEPALAHLARLPALPRGRIDPPAARLAALFAGLGPPGGTAAAIDACRLARFLSDREAASCRRLTGLREAPGTEAARRWFLHLWGEDWPTAAAALGALGEPPPAAGAWRRLVRRLAGLAERHAESIFAPRPLLDGNDIQRLLGVPPGPALGAAVDRLRRAQVEGRIADRAAAEALLRRSSSDAG